jgi:DNA transformation protein
MASHQSTADFIIDQLGGAGFIRTHRMFGEFALYCDEKVVGFICDDELYVKPTDISEQFLDATHKAPPYPGAKDYYKVPNEKLDDREWLTTFIKSTTVILPIPKPKKLKR